MSGLSRMPGKHVWVNTHRGFESRPFRQESRKHGPHRPVCFSCPGLHRRSGSVPAGVALALRLRHARHHRPRRRPGDEARRWAGSSERQRWSSAAARASTGLAGALVAAPRDHRQPEGQILMMAGGGSPYRCPACADAKRWRPGSCMHSLRRARRVLFRFCADEFLKRIRSGPLIRHAPSRAHTEIPTSLARPETGTRTGLRRVGPGWLRALDRFRPAGLKPAVLPTLPALVVGI